MACGSAVQTNVFTLRNWPGSASLTESYSPPRHYTALASSRESGEGAAGTISASTRFPFPLIEPDARIFPIRLPDWFRCTHATCERVLRKLGQRRHSRPVHPISRASAAGQRLCGSGMLVGVVGLIANRRPWSSSQAHQNLGFSTGVTQLRGHMPLTNSRLTPRPALGWGSPAPVHTSVPRSGLLPLGTRHACYPGGSAWVLGSICFPSRPGLLRCAGGSNIRDFTFEVPLGFTCVTPRSITQPPSGLCHEAPTHPVTPTSCSAAVSCQVLPTTSRVDLFSTSDTRRQRTA